MYYVCICMCVCVYVCVYVCKYVCIMYVCIYVCMCVCMYVNMYVCMYYVCMYVYICMYVCVYVCMYVCVWSNSVKLDCLCDSITSYLISISGDNIVQVNPEKNVYFAVTLNLDKKINYCKCDINWTWN